MFSVLPCRRVERQGARRTESYHRVHRTSGTQWWFWLETRACTMTLWCHNVNICISWFGEKRENEYGFCGSNKHTFPPKQTSLGTDWCRFGPQCWDSLKGRRRAFFLSYNIYVTYVFLFHAGLLGRHTMHASFGLMQHWFHNNICINLLSEQIIFNMIIDSFFFINVISSSKIWIWLVTDGQKSH